MDAAGIPRRASSQKSDARWGAPIQHEAFGCSSNNGLESKQAPHCWTMTNPRALHPCHHTEQRNAFNTPVGRLTRPLAEQVLLASICEVYGHGESARNASCVHRTPPGVEANVRSQCGNNEPRGTELASSGHENFHCLVTQRHVFTYQGQPTQLGYLLNASISRPGLYRTRNTG